jgi:hypothetical protein
VMMLLAATTAWAQAGTAGVAGTVKDAQGAVVPGATVTATNQSLGTARTTTSNAEGAYSIPGLPPGDYTLKVELTGFRTFVHEKVTLRVDSMTTVDAALSLGSLSETVTVSEATPIVNTTDASVGNTMSHDTIERLPVEGRNVVHLLSLQPGAVFIPTTNANTTDPRYGAVSGSRADQQNVTLDGIDVNDPQLQAAYTSAVRMTQEALQEFKVSTSNYGADAGRSSGAQVSLVTRSGTNQFDGSAYGFIRRTQTSSDEYFHKLAQLQADKTKKPKAPKLDKNIFGGALGGPVKRNRTFFFGNYEGLQESSETPVTRAVPSESFRDGVLMYQCAVASDCPGGSVQGFATSHPVKAGWYGLSPGQIGAIDPLGIGPSVAASKLFKQYPLPNAPGLDNANIMDYLFAAPIENRFHTFIGRIDHKLAANHTLFGRMNAQDDTINSAPQFEGQPSASQTLNKNIGFAIGYDAALTPSLVNSLRYGVTRIDSSRVGTLKSNYVTFLIDAGDADPEHRRRPVVAARQAYAQGRHEPALHAHSDDTRQRVVAEHEHQSLVGGGRRTDVSSRRPELLDARVRGASGGCEHVPCGLRGRVAEHPGGSVAGEHERELRQERQPPGGGRTGRAEIRVGRVRMVRSGQLAHRIDAHAERRHPLQPVLAALRSERAAGGAVDQHGAVVQGPRGWHAGGGPLEQEPHRHVRSRRTEERQAGFLRLGQEQLGAAYLRRVDAAPRARTVRVADG